MSLTVESALAGAKVMYLGGNFITPFFLLFIINYCEIDFLKKYITALILAFPAISVIFIWTTDFHTFFYKAYTHDANASHLGLQVVVPGVIYNFTHIFTNLNFFIIIADIAKCLVAMQQ